MNGRIPGWPLLGALAFCAGAGGVVYAQTVETPEVTAAPAQTEEAGSEELELNMPDLLPGYYNQTFTFRNMTMDMPTKWGGTPGRGFNIPPRTDQVCYTGEQLQRASEFLPGNIGGMEDCRVVSSTLEGTRGEGEIACSNQQMRMVIRYAGDFTETSAQISFNGEIRSKLRGGNFTFKFDIGMERIAETCAEETEGEEPATAVVPIVREVELKKM